MTNLRFLEDSHTEAALSAELRETFARLGARCVWRSEVWMTCWTHALREKPDRLRIDYVVELDNRLVGVEVKAPAEHAATLGKQLLQCAQYAAGKIAPNRADIPSHWIGKPLDGVFLRTRPAAENNEWLHNHTFAAHRLYGPANVGFLVMERRGLCLVLCGNRFWTEWRGWNQGMLQKAARVGNGSFQPTEA